ncbi:hypothetical protein B0O99DRAFT_610462 [Bisporella sp. PMI_857]|nr:hypothetical protein B0O99DRAFT_610462 [Bisporella sp. PMI_857]
MRYPGHKYPGIDENTSPQKKECTLKKPPPFPTNNAKLKHRDGKIGSPFRNAKSEPPHRKASDFSLLEFNMFQSSKDSANKAAENSPCGTAEAAIENVTPEQESSADLLAKRSGSENPKETTGHDEASKAQDKPDANENFQHLITRRDSNATIMRWKHNSVRKPGKSAPRNSVKMSYIHDFTDCPINKAILDYYERQQQLVDGKEQEHGLEDCGQSTDPSTSTIASASGTRSPDHQHELDEYSPSGSGGGSQDPGSTQKARHYDGKLNPDEDADGEQVTMASERSGHLEKNNEGNNTKAEFRAQHHHNRHIGHHAGHLLDHCTIQGSSQDYTTGSDKKESLRSRDLMYNENMPDPSSASKGGKNQDHIVEKQKGKVRIDDEACEISAAAPKSDEGSRNKLASSDHAIFKCPDELASDGTQGGSKQANTDEIQIVEHTIYQCPNNDTVVDSIAYSAAMLNKSTGRKTFKTLQLSDGVINSHKDSQWDHDNQQVLVHALSKCFPTKFKEYDTGASDPLVTLEHALGENHASSLANKGNSGQPLEIQLENKKGHSVQLPEPTLENKENDSG